MSLSPTRPAPAARRLHRSAVHPGDIGAQEGSADRLISYRRLRSAAANLLLALVYAVFIYGHVTAFAESMRPSLVFMITVETIILILVFARRDASATWHTWWTWATTLGGTFAPMLFRPADLSADLLIGQLVQLGGLSLLIAAVCSLNRSFGLLPAHRGIKSGGLYRAVRHPLYASYTLAHIGYVINNLTAYNLAVFAVVTGLQILRIRNEEAFLLQDPEYTAYARRTRWRLVPLAW